MDGSVKALVADCRISGAGKREGEGQPRMRFISFRPDGWDLSGMGLPGLGLVVDIVVRREVVYCGLRMLRGRWIVKTDVDTGNGGNNRGNNGLASFIGEIYPDRKKW